MQEARYLSLDFRRKVWARDTDLGFLASVLALDSCEVTMLGKITKEIMRATPKTPRRLTQGQTGTRENLNIPVILQLMDPASLEANYIHGKNPKILKSLGRFSASPQF